MKTFNQWYAESGSLKIEHTEGCNKSSWKAPVRECPCNCYEKGIWLAALKAVGDEIITEEDWRDNFQ